MWIVAVSFDDDDDEGKEAMLSELIDVEERYMCLAQAMSAGWRRNDYCVTECLQGKGFSTNDYDFEITIEMDFRIQSSCN